MSEVTERAVDRAGWPPGEWDAEPDRVDFEHAGFSCVLARHPQIGAWWGWVLLPASHPRYGQTVKQLRDLEVHGGLNVAWKEDGGRWMVSFDCAHVGDLCPGMLALKSKLGLSHPADPLLLRETYRPFAYAKRECERLAEQLRALAGAQP
jgi:hypothetical protein